MLAYAGLCAAYRASCACRELDLDLLLLIIIVRHRGGLHIREA